MSIAAVFLIVVDHLVGLSSIPSWVVESSQILQIRQNRRCLLDSCWRLLCTRNRYSYVIGSFDFVVRLISHYSPTSTGNDIGENPLPHLEYLVTLFLIFASVRVSSSFSLFCLNYLKPIHLSCPREHYFPFKQFRRRYCIKKCLWYQ